MKTIKDALEFYNYEWPERYKGLEWIGLGFRIGSDGILPYQSNSLIYREDMGNYKICTREEFEKAAAEHKAGQKSVTGYVEGQKIEYRAMDTSEWFDGVYVKKHTCADGIVINVIECDEKDPHSAAFDGIPDSGIRPIKTEREKFIEAGIKAAECFEPECDATFLGALFDSGKFKLVDE